MNQKNVRVHEGGIIYPRLAPEQFGCADRNLRLSLESLLYRDQGHYGQLWQPYKPEKYVDQKVIYGGILMCHHYGHFLIDSLSRLWYAAQHPEMPICWCGSVWENSYVAYEKEILNMLGIKNEAIFATEAMSFREVHVPEPGYVMATYFAKDYRRFLARMPASKMIPGKKIYLSRRKLVPGESNEEYLEYLLERDGFKIFFPEEHSVAEQLRELTSSELITGIMGSAFHTLLLTEKVESKIILFSRPQGIDGNFKFIADQEGWDQYIFDANVWLKRNFNARTPTRSTGILNIPYVYSVIKDCGKLTPLSHHMRYLHDKKEKEALRPACVKIYRLFKKIIKKSLMKMGYFPY